MQNNNGTLEVQPTLTEIGKKRMLENRFNITKFALADDGVNYKLVDKNIIDPELAVKRTPVLSVWKDSSFNMNNKLLVNKDDPYKSEKNFNPSFAPLERVEVNPVNIGEINFPRTIKESNSVTLQYYVTGNDISKLSHDTRIEIPFSMTDEISTAERLQSRTLLGANLRDDDRRVVDGDVMGNFIVATISDSTYFDLYLESDSNPYRGILNGVNFDEAFEVSDEKKKFPKTINFYVGEDNSKFNSFVLHYKGNFKYESVDTEIYETTITLMEENTGRFQKLKVQLIPSSRQSEN